MKHLQPNITKPTSQAATVASYSTGLTYTADPPTADIMRACERGISWRPDNGDPPQSLRVPSVLERQMLDRRRVVLDGMVRPSAHSREHQVRAGAAIAEMLDGYTSLRGIDRSGLVAGFVTDLQSLPAWAIELACGKVRRAEVDGLSLNFAPSTPQMFALVRKEIEPLREEERRIAAVLLLEPRREPDEAEQQRMAEKAQAWLDRTDPTARQIAAGAVNRKPPSIEELLTAHGVSREQWDALPDAR